MLPTPENDITATSSSAANTTENPTPIFLPIVMFLNISVPPYNMVPCPDVHRGKNLFRPITEWFRQNTWAY